MLHPVKKGFGQIEKHFQNNFLVQADSLLSLGLADLGYTTLTIDDRSWSWYHREVMPSHQCHQVAPGGEGRKRKDGCRPWKISKRHQVFGRLYASEVTTRLHTFLQWWLQDHTYTKCQRGAQNITIFNSKQFDIRFYIRWLLKTFLIFIKSCTHFKTRGLRLGLYSSAGVFTCSGFLPGSLAHERCNANFFFVW